MAQSRIVKITEKPVVLKASDVIRMASTHPTYLVSEHWLCSVIYRMQRFESVITYEERQLAEDAIEKALKGSAFLRPLLVDTHKITRGTSYGSPLYASAAQKFWQDLINDLHKVNK